MPTLNVLMVEDDESCGFLVEAQLRQCTEANYEVTRVETLKQALAHLHSFPVDLILLDLCLPDSNGLDSIPRLKSAAHNVPIVVLTGTDGEKIALQAIESGAQEYLSKDHVVGVLLKRAIRHSIARQKQLVKAQAEALKDPLTGMKNRRAFDLEYHRLEVELARSANPFCVAIVDIDHFKKVNDTWGHETGDAVICHVGRLLVDSVREGDTVARYGGEEFGLIFPAAKLADAEEVVERTRAEVAARQCEWGDTTVGVTFSAGVAEATPNAFDDCVARADQALYVAKEAGRNQVRSESKLQIEALTV